MTKPIIAVWFSCGAASAARLRESTERIIEGVVWHHPDGRMAKIKRKDFGLKW